jgi:hypothetical protein
MTLAQIGVGLVRLPPAWGAWLGAALCAGMVLVSAMSVPYAYGPKQDYAGAIEFIEANEQAGDLVTTAGLASLPYKEFYGRDWQEITTVDRLNALRAGARRTWLIYTFPTVLESVYPDVMVSIKSDFQVIKEFPGTVGDGSIFVCRADSAAAQKGQ